MLFPHRTHSTPKSGTRSPSDAHSEEPLSEPELARGQSAQATDIEVVARAIEARGMAAPAIVALQASRPLSWLGGQLLWVLQPLFEGVGVGQGKKSPFSVPGLARMLEQQGAVERLSARLEAGMDQVDRQRRAGQHSGDRRDRGRRGGRG